MLIRALSSVGRATRLHRVGRGFKSLSAHNDSREQLGAVQVKHHCDALRDLKDGVREGGRVRVAEFFSRKISVTKSLSASSIFMKDSKELNIVDENGKIVGKETRKNIHKQGLLHQEIHVWFYTPKGEIIFQHRAKDKDTYPDLLDATVGGHIEIEADYESTALQELKEETGINVIKDDLTFVQMVRIKTYDRVTKMTNNVIRAVYAYCYSGRIGDLKVEEGETVGFEVWPFRKIFNISSKNRKRFIPDVLGHEALNILRKIQKL